MPLDNLYANLRMEYMCNLKPKELAYFEFNCFVNAVYNRDNAYKPKNLKFVVGSLGLGVKPFWEYGGVEYKDLKDFYAGQDRFDAHAWLEDDEGNVFDYVYPSFLRVAHLRNRHIKLKVNTPVEGKSKLYRAKKGLHYLKAPDDIHDKLVGKVMHRVQETLSQVDKIRARTIAT